VDASEYSTFKGVPTAGFGFLYYLIVLIYGLSALSKPEKRSSGLSFAIFMSLISLGVSLFMAYISFFKLDALCITCLGMYITNLLLVITIPLAAGTSLIKLPHFVVSYLEAIFSKNSNLDLKPKFWLHLIFSVLFVLFGAMIFHNIEADAIEKAIEAKRKALYEQNNPGEITLEKAVELHFNQPVLNFGSLNHSSKGNDNAKVVIHEFSDFQCPFCKRAAEYFSSLIKDRGDEVKFNYVHYPLDKNCNPYMKNSFHDSACLASKAAICAGDQGDFWGMHDLIFSDQKQINSSNIEKYSNELNLDWSSMQGCMISSKTNDRILADIELGQKVGVGGTPSVYINGRKLNGWTNREFLEAVIDEELKRAR
jgi:protein-disulfide isomerase